MWFAVIVRTRVAAQKTLPCISAWAHARQNLDEGALRKINGIIFSKRDRRPLCAFRACELKMREKNVLQQHCDRKTRGIARNVVRKISMQSSVRWIRSSIQICQCGAARTRESLLMIWNSWRNVPESDDIYGQEMADTQRKFRGIFCPICIFFYESIFLI